MKLVRSRFNRLEARKNSADVQVVGSGCNENKTGQNKWKVAARFCFRKLGSQGKILISANALGFG